MTDPYYLPTPEEIAALRKKIREEREQGLITKQIRDRRGVLRHVVCRDRQRTHESQSDVNTKRLYVPPIYRTRKSRRVKPLS